MSETVKSVKITVTGCGKAPSSGPQNLSVIVEPWVANVKAGEDFDWIIEGDMTDVKIAARGERWPFEHRDFPATAPGRVIKAGKVEGSVGDRARYDIIIRCRDLTLTIDPDIFILEPPSP